MIRNHKQIAIVLARGGSTRLPNKNLLEIDGKSLTLRAIEGALSNNLHVILSSDDQRILNSIDHPFVQRHERSEENSSALSSSEQSVLEAIDSLQISDETELLLLQPTSPFRTSLTVSRFLSEWSESSHTENFDSAFSAFVDHSEYWNVSASGNLRIRSELNIGDSSQRSQDRIPLYRENGAIYLTKAKRIRSGLRFINGKSFIFTCNFIESIDVDTEEEFRFAQAISSSLGT